MTELLGYVASITDADLRHFTNESLGKAPELFWTLPASSSGKHHPEQSNGEGGLVRHILACLYFLKEFTAMYDLTQPEVDIITSALILHDIGKAIAEPHDCTAVRFLVWQLPPNPSDMLKDTISCVRWHMGRWSTGSTDCLSYERGNKIFPDHFSKLEAITHLCDYAASRKRVNLTKLGV